MQEDRDGFATRLAAGNMTPLWDVLHRLVAPEPASTCAPAVWHYDEVRPLLAEAGARISAAEAERRVLILENPGLAGQSRITTSLYAGLQLVLPGEIAPAHRHTQSALRFILEGGGGYTAVDGEKMPMSPGDFVITPAWTWHDHGNDGDDPVVWLDGLDIPLIQALDASFAERAAEPRQAERRPPGDSLARFGSGMRPDGWRPAGPASPVLSYPYARTRAALAALAEAGEWCPALGIRSWYVNPATGGHALPSIGAFLQLLPAAFAGAPYRSSDATVYAVAEGRGRTEIGALTIAWGPRDVFVVPSWRPHRHVAEAEAVLFGFSDRPVQESLGIWREDRGRAGD